MAYGHVQGQMDEAKARTTAAEANMAAHTAQLNACQQDLESLQAEAKAAEEFADKV